MLLYAELALYAALVVSHGGAVVRGGALELEMPTTVLCFEASPASPEIPVSTELEGCEVVTVATAVVEVPQL